jgi:hypothetical protein
MAAATEAQASKKAAMTLKAANTTHSSVDIFLEASTVIDHSVSKP